MKKFQIVSDLLHKISFEHIPVIVAVAWC